MGRGGPLRLGLALALVLVAQDTLADVCRTGCNGASHNTFKYAQGTTYKYNYEGKIEISLSSADGQVTSTDVKAVVLLTQQADCNQVLRLENVQIFGPNGKKLGSIPHVDKPIRINFHDGHIEDSICTEPGDTQNSLNIKRAIASLFQANLKQSYETDVFGLCPTEIVQHQEGNILVIQKSRHLNKCGYREHLRQDFFSTTFNQNSEIKSSPILDGEYNAKLKVKNGILDQATAVENYLYVPFSVGKQGAKAQVTSKLQFKGTAKDTKVNKCSVPKTILFDNPHSVPTPTNNVNTILNAVKAVDKSIDVVVGEQTAKEFINLVKTIRSSKKADLLSVYNQVRSGAGLKDKVACKKAFLDALLQAGTGETIEVAVTLLKNNELNDVEKYMVYIGLSLVRYVNEASLTSAAALLDQPHLSYEAYLGIGNLAGRFCGQQSCENVPAVNKLSQKLIQKLGTGKPANRQAENDMVYILKSLRNFGHLTDSGIQKIIAIAQNKQVPNRLRVVALETYLADACKDKLRNSALHILQDIQQDSEVRIKAYQVLAQCPTAKIGTAVKALLEKEPSNQVGGYIVSHIRNIKASANPDKDLAKQHLGFSVPKKFPIDFRKWSYNGEFSYAVDTLGIAASSEANVIYSQDSFLPRSTSLNLTGQVFGHTFNFLEISTRQENLDKLVEHYFGPKGILSTSSVGDLFNANDKLAGKLWKRLEQKLSSTLRSRRDVTKAEIDNIGKAVQIKENALNKDLDLDLSVKAFGSEVFFTNLNIYQEGLTPEAIIDKIVDNFAKGLDSLKSYKETLRSNIIFLDVEFDYPTGLGFPLRIAAEGTANVQVQTEGAVDVRSLLAGKDTNIHVKLIPSASIEVTGRLTLDASVIENGLKTVSTLYTATGGDLTINIFNGGKGYDVKFGLPVQEQKILAGSHEIVFNSRDQSGHDTTTSLKFAQSKDFSICVDQLSPFIGLAFCAEMNGPNVAGEQTPILPFPLSGDAKFFVSIENENLKEFHYRTSYEKFKSGEILFEAIGKNREKLLGLQVSAQISPEIFLLSVLDSAQIKAHAEGRITNNNQEKSLMVRVGQNQVEWYGKVGVAISGSPNRAQYRPILEYRPPAGSQGQLPLKVDGQIVVEQNGRNNKYVFDNIKVTLPNNQILNLNGNIGVDENEVYSDLTLSDGHLLGSLKGRLHVDPQLVKFNVEVKNSINPSANFNFKGEVKRQEDNSQYDSSFQLIHGADLSSKTNIITLVSSASQKYKNPHDFAFAFKEKLKYPLVGLNFEVEYGETPNSFDYDFDFEYGDIKFGSELELEVNKKTVGDYDAEFEIYGLGNKVAFKGNRLVQGEQSKINHELDVNGMKMEVKGTLKHHIQPTNLDIGADLTIVLPTHPTPFKVNSGCKWNPSEIDAHHKVTSGSNVIIDTFLKANKNGNANGNVKVNIKNILVVNGQLKSIRGKGNANILIDAQSVKKQVKLESTFQILPEHTFIVDVTLYPTFNKDKSQKIILSTHNKLSLTSIDSKNSVVVLGKKLEANLKASNVWDNQNEKLNGEIELILPNDQYVLGKVHRDAKRVNEVLNGQAQASLEYRKNKNAAGRKVSIKSTYVNTNLVEAVYDVTYNIAADDSNGKNINADLVFKSKKEGEQRVVEGETKIYGSILKNTAEASWFGKYTQMTGEYKYKNSYGPQFNLDASGKYNVENNGKPFTGAISFDVITPSKEIRKLKWESVGLLQIPKDSSQTFVVEASSGLFVDDDGTVPDPIIDYKGEGQIKASDKDAELKGSISYGKYEPISGAAAYSYKTEGEKKQVNGNVAVQYGKDKNFKAEGSLIRPNKNEYKINTEINTPYDGYKKTIINVDTKTSDDHKHVTSQTTVNHDGKLWTLDSEIRASDISPLIDIKVKDPEGKKVQYYLKVDKHADRESKGESKFLCERSDFLFEQNWDVNVNNIENFFIKWYGNSPNYHLNKVLFEAQNKPGKTGKRIQFTITSAGKNIVSGSTNYQARDEHGKYVVEGSGSVKIKDATKPLSFKYICHQLSLQKDGEQGIDVSLDASVGNMAIDSEFKTTNKQFRYLSSYCETNKECTHVEIDSKVNSNEIDNYNHVLEISLDFRKLGIPHEFGLKSVTDLKNHFLDHTVDVHFQGKENKKYQYKIYLQQKEAVISYTTPKRVVSLEAIADFPKDLLRDGKYQGEVAFYFDKKNQPNNKAGISAWLNFNKQAGTVNGESKFVYPGVRALSTSIKSQVIGDLAGKGEVIVNVVLDVFAKPDQKLVSVLKYNQDIKGMSYKNSLEIKSAGLGIDITANDVMDYDSRTYNGIYALDVKYKVGNSKYDNVFLMKAGKSSFDFLIKSLNVNLLKITGTMNLDKGAQVVDAEISSYDNKPLQTHIELKKFNTLFYTIGFKDTPKEKLQFSVAFIPGQIADIRADHVTASGKVNLYQANVKLAEAEFLKPDYSINSKEIEKTLEQSKQRYAHFLTGLQHVGEEFSNDIRKEIHQLQEISKRATPNFAPFKQHCVSELQKIKNEILQDKAIKDIAELFEKVFGTLARSAADLFVKFSELLEELGKTLQTTYDALAKIVERDLIPAVDELVKKLIAIVGDITGAGIEIVSGYIATVSEIMEKYQPEIKQLAAIFSELSHNVARFIQKSYDEVRKIFTEVTKKIYDELKALPVFEELQAQYEDFIKNGLPSKEGIVTTLEEIAATIKDFLAPNEFIPEEVTAIIDLTVNYLSKKIRQEPVDDFAVLDQLISLNVALIKKVLNEFSSPTYDIKQADFGPVSFDFFQKLPKLVAIKFSPLSYLLTEDTSEEAFDFLLSLVNHPRHWFAPFPMFGVVLQGRHIFTFDGKYLTFPGNCKYLLARDAAHGNFTIIGSYKDGRLAALTLADKHDFITIKNNGQVLLNNVATEYPARKPELSAWRTYEMINIKSTAGVKIECTPDLGGCGFYINGFYHSQVKGLLGNGNNEPYDDFTIPNGKIVTAESEFGNSYKIGNCQPVTVPKNDISQENPICNKLFGWESSMSPCFPFVKTDNFKIACAHGLAANIEHTEMAIASAYVGTCHEHNIPISIPSHLLQCTNSMKPFNVGERFSVKVPNEAADIIVLVDTTKSNEKLYTELLKPLLQDVVKTLASKSINDVQLQVIAYGGENLWPSHVSVGGKLTFSDKLPDLKFSEKPKTKEEFSEGIFANIKRDLEPIERIIHDIKLAIGDTLEGHTYSEAFNYPFRAHAVKSIIVLTSKPCEVGNLEILQRLRTVLYRNDQISLNLITPFDSFSVKDKKKSADVVGFNDQNVFTLSLGKKKPDGNSELYKDLHYHDYCVDFTIKNRGNVFVANNFVNAKQDAKKQYIHIAAHNVVEEILNVEEGLDCECKKVGPYSAANVCSEVYSKERPTKKGGTKS
ncbi:retinoid- and fatty-acid binding glycoprotein apolipophorin [Leptinotarsa decemlineata]|uniref:retinoid- and fatty-acid binding glycoprotein apolipophorin n=1 Tax=Leptinotarsa decemlineata TaxID=7539 RepID=UPI003D307126